MRDTLTLTKRRNVDTTTGPIFSNMIYFAIPLMLTNLIQQLYTIADNLVVGKFSTDESALGAIGSSAVVVAFLTALFSGFSVGTSATVAHDFGARDGAAIRKDVHTSVMLSLSVGFSIGLFGFIFARPILEMLSTKEEFIESAVVYLKIRCIGIPFVSLYNVGAATLRSVGDSRSPLRILTVSGLSNVLLNLFFVLALGMSSDGVALATLCAQLISAAWVYILLYKRKSEAYCFTPSALKIDKKTVFRILKFAIPGVFQVMGAHVMALFMASATNNIFAPEVIEARTIAGNIDTMLLTVLDTYVTTMLTFAGQNKGARKPERIKKALFLSLAQVCTIAIVLGQSILLCRAPLIKLFVNEENYNVDAIIEYATTIMTIMLTSYIIYAVCCSLSGFIRGLGHSLPTMVVALIDVFVLRTVWILVLFPRVGTLDFLYMLYPVSYVIFAAAYAAVSLVVWKRYKATVRDGDPALEKTT